MFDWYGFRFPQTAQPKPERMFCYLSKNMYKNKCR